MPGPLPLPLVSCLLLLLSCCRYVRGRCSCSADSALSCGVYGARRCRDGAVSVFCGACGAFRVLIVIVARVVLLLSWLLIGAGSVLTERLVRAAMPQRTLPASISVQSSSINCYRVRVDKVVQIREVSVQGCTGLGAAKIMAGGIAIAAAASRVARASQRPSTRDRSTPSGPRRRDASRHRSRNRVCERHPKAKVQKVLRCSIDASHHCCPSCSPCWAWLLRCGAC